MWLVWSKNSTSGTAHLPLGVQRSFDELLVPSLGRDLALEFRLGQELAAEDHTGILNLDALGTDNEVLLRFERGDRRWFLQMYGVGKVVDPSSRNSFTNLRTSRFFSCGNASLNMSAI